MRMNAIQKSGTLLLVGILAGCMPSFLSRPTGQGEMPTVDKQGGLHVVTQGDTTTIQRLDTVLKGRVTLEGGDRQTQATTAEVVGNATVAIIDTTTNVTVATSVTDGSGNFAIPLPASWNPPVNSTFVIEAFKGLGSNAAGQRVIRMRSLIQKLAGNGNFTSLTGSASIGISPMTTAVYLRSVAGVGNVPLTDTFYADKLGTVKLDGTLRQANQFTGSGVTDTQLTNLSTMVAASVGGNFDPIDGANAALVPQVTSFSTYMAAAGSLISINGSGFSPIPGNNTVTFNSGVSATVLYASKGQLIVAVPSGATNGNVTVTTTLGTSNATNFTVSAPVGSASGAPTLSSVSNAAPSPGLTIQLGGVNFVNGANTITFSAGAGTVTAAATYINANQLSVVVPASAKSGPITITNSNGTSNGHWVEVIHASGTIVEDFAGSTKRDAATNIQWVGGASPVGIGTAIQSTVADFDGNTKSNVQIVHDNANPLYPDSVRLAITEAYPIANAANIPTDNYIDGQSGAYGLATNGNQVYRNFNGTLQLISGGFDGLPLGMLNPNYNITNNIAANGTTDLAGFTDSPVYFDHDQTTPSFFGLSYQNLANPAAPVVGNAALYAADGVTAIGLFKNAGSTYGTRIASDGTYLYILSGVGHVAGVPTYNQPWNLYKFRPDSYTAPTKLILAQPPFENIVPPATSYLGTQYTSMLVDHRAFYLPGYPAGGSVYAMTPYSLRTGASKNLHVRFLAANGNYPTPAYDAMHDVYYAGAYNFANLYRHHITTKAYETAGSITTGVQSLPANSAWSQVSLVTDPLPAGTTVKYDVLTAGGAPIAGYQNLVSGASLRGLATTDIKIRVNLTGNSAVTPVVRAINLYTISNDPVARSTSFTIPGADANDRIIIDSVQITHSPNGGSLTYQYADSADNVSFSTFQDSFTSINRRYLKWQVIPAVATSTNSAMVPPITRRIQINYHY
ncbi:hypothetical protein J7643_17250 [bacterium]|nr:hypothetical protein [bacterium]